MFGWQSVSKKDSKINLIWAVVIDQGFLLNFLYIPRPLFTSRIFVARGLATAFLDLENC